MQDSRVFLSADVKTRDSQNRRFLTFCSKSLASLVSLAKTENPGFPSRKCVTPGSGKVCPTVKRVLAGWEPYPLYMSHVEHNEHLRTAPGAMPNSETGDGGEALYPPVYPRVRENMARTVRHSPHASMPTTTTLTLTPPPSWAHNSPLSPNSETGINTRVRNISQQ